MVVGEIEIGTDVLVIGAGPAGYTAAIRCGQTGLDTTLAGPQLGGVCLNLGCIPFKSLLHSLDLFLAARESGMFGVTEQASFDLQQAEAWKQRVVGRLKDGVAGLLKTSSVQVLEGVCSFESSDTAVVHASHGSQRVGFKRAVIATGSHFQIPPGIAVDNRRIMVPYGLSKLESVPGHAVVLGGGLGGATAASLLSKMGAEVTLAYKGKSLISLVDDDILQPVLQRMAHDKVRLFPGAAWDISPDGKRIKIISDGGEETLDSDLVVLATPQIANTERLGLGNTKVKLDEKGVVVDGDFRTADPSIYAIGDVLGGARNASTAFREGIAVARVLAGKPGLPAYQAMPFTIYTEPPIAAAGLTEKKARAGGLDIVVGSAPFAVNGAAALSGQVTGMAKVIADRKSHRILGVQIVGKNSTDMIAEGILAIEMGARLEDVALTLHPHPELCEVFYEACARAAGLSSNMAAPR